MARKSKTIQVKTVARMPRQTTVKRGTLSQHDRDFLDRMRGYRQRQPASPPKAVSPLSLRQVLKLLAERADFIRRAKRFEKTGERLTGVDSATPYVMWHLTARDKARYILNTELRQAPGFKEVETICRAGAGLSVRTIKRMAAKLALKQGTTLDSVLRLKLSQFVAMIRGGDKPPLKGNKPLAVVEASGKRGRTPLSQDDINTYREIYGEWLQFTESCKSARERATYRDFCDQEEYDLREVSRAIKYCKDHELAALNSGSEN